MEGGPVISMPTGILKLRVPQLLEERGWTASDLMRKSGLSWPTCQGLAVGKPMNVKLETVEKLLDTFQIELGDLVVQSPDGEESG
jgi:DNA-binding Xre family transcriptional regulator